MPWRAQPGGVRARPRGPQPRVDPDTAWKLQHRVQPLNRVYEYVNLQQGGRLVDTLGAGGVGALEELVRTELPQFLYRGGAGEVVSEAELRHWRAELRGHSNVS